MGARKLMTINDLYNFCISHNFCHFSSSIDEQEIYVQLPATFESNQSYDKDKEGLTPFVAKAYHDHINLNKSEIKPETLESTLPSAMIRPILANIITDEETGIKDFGSHDFVIETDNNGEEVIRYIEQPVGVIFGDNTIEYDEEAGVNRTILYGYLYDGYCQDAVDIMKRRKTVDCSVELSIREMSFNAKDKVLTLDDFYVSGLTLLGAEISPGMKGSQVTIEDFSKQNNSVFSANENSIVEILNQLNSKIDSLSSFTINHLNQEGGKTLSKLEELLAKYNKTLEEITFDYAELTDDELERKFAEEFNDDNTNDEADGSDEGNEGTASDGDNKTTEENFSDNSEEKLVRSYEISHDDIRFGLYRLLEEYEEADNAYYYITNVYDTYFVYENYDGSIVYGQAYDKNDESVVFSGERYELHKELLTASEYAELQRIRSSYSDLSARVSDYEQKELKAENIKKEEILASECYSKIAETDEFKELCNNKMNFSANDVEEKANALLGKFEKQLFFSKNKGISKQMFGTQDKEINAPYGGLFNKK